MFSGFTCNFFVPFAQKDARFGWAASRGAANLPSAQKLATGNEGLTNETCRRDHQTVQA
jgi:hypothetical protein